MTLKKKDKGFSGDYVQIFLFKFKFEYYRAIVNHTKKSYILYSPDGKFLVERSNISKVDIKKIEKEINEWLENQYRPQVIGW